MSGDVSAFCLFFSAEYHWQRFNWLHFLSVTNVLSVTPRAASLTVNALACRHHPLICLFSLKEVQHPLITLRFVEKKNQNVKTTNHRHY